MKSKGFLYGTLILVGAGLITKILGFVYRIALSRIIGDEGMGLFQMAFPILVFTIVVTTAGLPVAISKLVSEAEAKNETERVRSILIVSIFIVVITSVLITSFVLLFAPWIAKTLLTDQRAVYALLGIAPIIPIIAISSIFRGYFQGRQNMSPYAMSTIIEQTVRIFTVLILATILLPYGVEYAAAGAMIGMVIGEFAGLLYLLYSFKRDAGRPKLRKLSFTKKQHSQQWRESLRDLLRLAIPVTTSRLVGSFSYAIEPIVVSQSLALAGIATAAATGLYGQLEGMAIPLVFFPSFITYALSVSLVPAISEAAAQNNTRLVSHRLQQAVRLNMIVALPSALLMYMLAEPLSILLYRQTDVARLIQIMAPFTVLHAMQGPFASVLQGLDNAKAPMRNSIIGAVVKTILIFALASQPELGIDGVALAINCGIVIVTTLHFIDILKVISFRLPLKDLGKLCVATAATGLVTYTCIHMEHWTLFAQTAAGFFGSLSIYALCLVSLSLIRKDDVRRIPYVGKWMAKCLPH
ncbi:stage V sporulation protein B [Thermoactinomyces vulgaris]|nr:stage V sporulation protein B [Thermoactinomyces vulgaris]